MADEFGAVISEQGIPTNQASDDQKVLDTRWLTLDISAEPTYQATLNIPTDAPGDGTTLGFPTSPIQIYLHGLGHLAAFDYEITTQNISDPNATNQSLCVSDQNNIYYVPLIGSVDTSITVNIVINLRIYTLDITQEYQAPVVQSTPVVQPIQSQFGAQFLKSNVGSIDIHNASIDSYSFNTALRPLNILQTGVANGTQSGVLAITYSYGQHPMFTYATYFPIGVKFGGITFTQAILDGLDPTTGRSTIAGNTLTIAGVQAGLFVYAAYILFKDPMDLGV